MIQRRLGAEVDFENTNVIYDRCRDASDDQQNCRCEEQEGADVVEEPSPCHCESGVAMLR